MLELTFHFNKYLVTQSTQSYLVTQSKRRVRRIDLLVRVCIAEVQAQSPDRAEQGQEPLVFASFSI